MDPRLEIRLCIGLILRLEEKFVLRYTMRSVKKKVKDNVWDRVSYRFGNQVKFKVCSPDVEQVGNMSQVGSKVWGQA